MSSGNVTPYVDFGTNPNDTNDNNAASIQPINNGDAVNATTTARPSENLRKRTEAIRARQTDSLYLENADRTLVIAGPGKVTWPGSTTSAHTGIPVLSDVLYILPMLTPGFPQTAPIPPVASAFGVLHLKRADSVNAISVTSRRRSYAAGDQINVTVTAGAVYSCTLDVEDTGALQRTIRIVATGSTTLGTVIASLNGLTPASPDNTQLVTAALEGGALNSDLILTTQARQFVSGNYDGEGHAVTPTNLAAFFTANPTQALAEGDSLCISYAMLFDTASNGGRRQSIPENSNTAVPSGSFFNSRVHPELLYNALPFCKVINGDLVFGTGSTVPAGGTSVTIGSIDASSVTYAGGPNWADGTTNPATSVENELDKIITDLGGGTGGTAKISGAAVGTYVAAGTLASQVTKLANTIHDDQPPTEASRAPLRVLRDWQGNARSLFDHNGFRLGQVSEIDEHWNGTTSRQVVISPSQGAGNGTFNTSFWQLSAGQTVYFGLDPIPLGATITSIVITFSSAVTGQVANLGYNTTNLNTGSFLNGIIFKAVATTGASLVNSDLFVSPSSGHGPRYRDAQIVPSVSVNAGGGNTNDILVYGITVTYTIDQSGWTWSGGTQDSLANGDARNYLDPDTNFSQRSVQLVTASDGTNSGISGLVDGADVWIGADTIFVMDFMVRTGTIDDATHAAEFNVGIVGNGSPINAAGFYWDHSYANWMFRTQVGLGLTDNAAGAVAVTANTNYRMRIEVRGTNRTSSGLLEIYATVNGVAAPVVTPAFTGKAFKVFMTSSTTTNTAAGPYDFRIGRLRRVFNHLAAGDVL